MWARGSTVILPDATWRAAALGILLVACGARIERTHDDSGGLDQAVPGAPTADLAAPSAPAVAASPVGPNAAVPGQGRSNQGLSGATAAAGPAGTAAADVTEGVDEPPAEPMTLNVPASSLLTDAGACIGVWLDEPESEIAATDLTVTRTDPSGTSAQWPATEECTEVPAWSLIRDASGVWLQLCAAACVQLAPADTLTIVSSYSTEPRYLVR